MARPSWPVKQRSRDENEMAAERASSLWQLGGLMAFYKLIQMNFFNPYDQRSSRCGPSSERDRSFGSPNRAAARPERRSDQVRNVTKAESSE